MPYVATINTPGYLPMDDDPPVFETVAEAWNYLLDEYAMGWNDAEIDGDSDDALPESLGEVYRGTCQCLADAARAEQPGCIYAPTPGREADDPHDLGLAYCVSIAEEV